MSRTYKDAPYRVKQLRKMKDGHFDHQDKFEFSWRNKSYKVSRIEKVSFYKKDSAAIFQYKNILDEQGFKYEMEEQKGYYKYVSKSGSRWDIANRVMVEYIPKVIVFHIEVEKEYKTVYSDTCVDLDNYDSFSGMDKRNGKIASCVPFLEPYDKKEYRSSWNEKNKVEYSKSDRHADLKKIVKAYNTQNNDFDDIMGDEAFVHDEIIYEDFKTSLWW